MIEINRVIEALDNGFATDDALIDAVHQTFIDMDGYEFEQAILEVVEPGNPDLNSFIDSIRSNYVGLVIQMIDGTDEHTVNHKSNDWEVISVRRRQLFEAIAKTSDETLNCAIGSTVEAERLRRLLDELGRTAP